MRLFNDLTGKGTYATPERAEKKVKEYCSAMATDFRYIIAVNSEGRYFPVIIPTRDQQCYAGGIAHNGICVTF